MPILSGGLVTAALVEEVTTPDTPVWSEDYGTISATWIDPDGVEWPLSNDGNGSPWFTMNGPGGWGANVIELVTDPLPRGGEQVRYVLAKPRRINWPIYIGGHDDHQAFTDDYRRLVRAITKTSVRRAPGWLRISRPNGRWRQIACYYEQGLEGEAGENHRFAKPVVTFFCPDGYWSGDRPVTAYRQFTNTTAPAGGGGGGGGTSTPAAANFFNPYFNLANSKIISGGGSSEGGGEGGGTAGDATTITNTGDVEAWPVWKLTGPMSYLMAENMTVGTRFGLRYNLLDGQTITITTNRPSVRGPGNANLTGSVEWFDPAGCELWPLRDGDNQIRFRVDGAGPGTRVDLSFTPRYETA